MTDQPIIQPRENTAETMRKVITDLAGFSFVNSPGDCEELHTPTLIEVSQGRRVEDLTESFRKAAEYFRPLRRKGTARLDDLQSLVDWSNRFKGENSALFAKPDMANPSLMCIADYHAEGPENSGNLEGDNTARHCHHRAVYNFPLHDDWKAWTGISGRALDKDEMGEFIEAHAKDILEPTPALLGLKEAETNQNWENRLIQTARHIEGRYGQLRELLAMSRHFQVHETSNLTVTTNRDTGEGSIQFLNEHKDADGAPIRIPNLIIIAVPVFRAGAPYRLAVRFRYRKSGSTVKFILSLYNPEKAFEDAFNEAVETAHRETDIPVFRGTPEA